MRKATGIQRRAEQESGRVELPGEQIRATCWPPLTWRPRYVRGGAYGTPTCGLPSLVFAHVLLALSLDSQSVTVLCVIALACRSRTTELKEPRVAAKAPDAFSLRPSGDHTCGNGVLFYNNCTDAACWLAYSRYRWRDRVRLRPDTR